MSQVQITLKDGFLWNATISAKALIIAITWSQFHFNLIKKFAELFFYDVYSNNHTKVRFKITQSYSILAFVGHIQGGIVTEQNMNNIKFTDAKQAKLFTTTDAQKKKLSCCVEHG